MYNICTPEATDIKSKSYLIAATKYYKINILSKGSNRELTELKVEKFWVVGSGAKLVENMIIALI